MSQQFSPTLLAIAIASILVSSCGSDSNKKNTAAELPAPINGQFFDSAVAGLDYTTTKGLKGTTDADGKLSCHQDDTVTFTLGGISLGSASCAAKITPMSLIANAKISDDGVINRLITLQLFDEDRDPANGITLSKELKAALGNQNLDFSSNRATFNTSLNNLLAKLPDSYKTRTATDSSRLLAREHFENTLATTLKQPLKDSLSQVTPLGTIAATITRYQIQSPDSAYVPYEGSNASISKEFPKGFLPSFGSGLSFKNKLADGSLEFYAITDRGPNGDGPKVPNASVTAGSTGTSDGKYFPAPSFVPSIGVVRVNTDGAQLVSTMPIKFSSTQMASGLPLAAGKVGSSGEIPLNDSAQYQATGKAIFSDYGVDTESVVLDTARNVLWASDEYGPFILKIDLNTGIILKKYQPGNNPTDLPAVLAKRRANRGMEGLALETASGKLHGFIQSPLDDGKASYKLPGASTATNESIKDYAAFTRWIEFDPTTETSRLYAYPIDSTKFASGKTGSAKLGDLVSLGNGKFVVIEQGAGTDGAVFNHLMLVQIPNDATNIATFNSDLEKSSMTGTAVNNADYTKVVPLRKTLLLNLNSANWLAEKAEGLALVDDSTIALVNDGDFGLKTLMFDAFGAALNSSDVTKCTVDNNGSITTTTSAASSGCTAGNRARVGRGADIERPNRLWLIKFDKKLTDFVMP